MTKTLAKKPTRTKKQKNEEYSPVKIGLAVATLGAVTLVVCALLAIM